VKNLTDTNEDMITQMTKKTATVTKLKNAEADMLKATMALFEARLIVLNTELS
jgi:hypothetical protein